MKIIILLVAMLSIFNSFASLSDNYEVHELKKPSPLKSEDLTFLVYKELKKQLQTFNKNADLKFEQVSPVVTAWLKEDGGEFVVGMIVEDSVSTQNPENKDEEMSCKFYLIHNKEDISEDGTYYVDTAICKANQKQ